MFNPEDSNLKKFLKSPHHGWLMGLTLGVGLVSAHPLVMVAALTLYALGWIYLPDMGIFKSWVRKNEDQLAAFRSRDQAQAFRERRQTLLTGLTPERMRRYLDVARVCQDIEKATQDSGANPGEDADPRLRKLDELMWTFLRLLVMEGSLESFLETESKEELSREIDAGKAAISALTQEITAATTKGENTTAKVRLLDSKKERLAVLNKRQERVIEAKENVTLVAAEQDRLVEQIKLLRADAIAARNADTLTARIDATVEHLTETNKLFSEMDQFKDLVSDDMPQTEERLGFSAGTNIAAPPVLDKGYSVKDRRVGQRASQ